MEKWILPGMTRSSFKTKGFPPALCFMKVDVAFPNDTRSRTPHRARGRAATRVLRSESEPPVTKSWLGMTPAERRAMDLAAELRLPRLAPVTKRTSSDFCDLFAALDAVDAEYLPVGALALAAQSHIRRRKISRFGFGRPRRMPIGGTGGSSREYDRRGRPG
jgi:hypothetical protein